MEDKKVIREITLLFALKHLIVDRFVSCLVYGVNMTSLLPYLLVCSRVGSVGELNLELLCFVTVWPDVQNVHLGVSKEEIDEDFATLLLNFEAVETDLPNLTQVALMVESAEQFLKIVTADRALLEE